MQRARRLYMAAVKRLAEAEAAPRTIVSLDRFPQLQRLLHDVRMVEKGFKDSGFQVGDFFKAKGFVLHPNGERTYMVLPFEQQQLGSVGYHAMANLPDKLRADWEAVAKDAQQALRQVGNRMPPKPAAALRTVVVAQPPAHQRDRDREHQSYRQGGHRHGNRAQPPGAVRRDDRHSPWSRDRPRHQPERGPSPRRRSTGRRNSRSRSRSRSGRRSRHRGLSRSCSRHSRSRSRNRDHRRDRLDSGLGTPQDPLAEQPKPLCSVKPRSKDPPSLLYLAPVTGHRRKQALVFDGQCPDPTIASRPTGGSLCLVEETAAGDSEVSISEPLSVHPENVAPVFHAVAAVTRAIAHAEEASTVREDLRGIAALHDDMDDFMRNSFKHATLESIKQKFHACAKTLRDVTSGLKARRTGDVLAASANAHLGAALRYSALVTEHIPAAHQGPPLRLELEKGHLDQALKQRLVHKEGDRYVPYTGALYPYQGMSQAGHCYANPSVIAHDGQPMRLELGTALVQQQSSGL